VSKQVIDDLLQYMANSHPDEIEEWSKCQETMSGKTKNQSTCKDGYLWHRSCARWKSHRSTLQLDLLQVWRRGTSYWTRAKHLLSQTETQEATVRIIAADLLLHDISQVGLRTIYMPEGSLSLLILSAFFWYITILGNISSYPLFLFPSRSRIVFM